MRTCVFFCLFFFFKQKTAYEMRISDWSSDVCSSDLHLTLLRHLIDLRGVLRAARAAGMDAGAPIALQHAIDRMAPALRFYRHGDGGLCLFNGRSEERRGGKECGSSGRSRGSPGT